MFTLSGFVAACPIYNKKNSIIYIIKNSKKYLNRKIEDLNVRNGDLNLRKRYLNTFKKK